MSRALPAWFLLFSILLCFACNQDDPSNIGSSFLDDSVNPDIQFTDELELKATLVRKDSVQSGLRFFNTVRRPHLLGAIDNDPVFGSSFAGVYMQMAPADNVVFKDENLTFDSLYLFIDYVNIEAYGDTSKVQNWVVYEMDEQMDSMRSYSNINFDVIESQVLGRLTDFKLEPTKNYETETDTTDSKFRVDLSDSDLGQRMVDVLSDPLDSTFVYADQYKDFFKGIYIAPDTSLENSAIATVDLFSQASGIVLHYSDLSIPEVDNRSQVLSFVAGSDTCHALNHFEHNYTTAADQSINDVLASADQSLDEFIYLQGHAGLEVEIDFPNLDNLGNILVNKAELVMTHIAEIEPEVNYAIPTNIDFRSTMEGVPVGDGEGDLFYINDYAVIPQTTVDEKDTLNTTVTSYTFNLNLFFQEMLTADPEERKIRLSISNRASFFPDRQAILADDYMMERLILAGPDHPDDAFRMKVNLHYTELVP